MRLLGPTIGYPDHSLLLLISYRGSDVRPVEVYNMEHIVILHDRGAERRSLRNSPRFQESRLAIENCRPPGTIVLKLSKFAMW